MTAVSLGSGSDGQSRLSRTTYAMTSASGKKKRLRMKYPMKL